MPMHDCPACAGHLPHQHRGGVDCVHALSSGEWRACCAEYAAEMVALFAAARRGVPDTPEAALWLDDPLRAVWLAQDGADAAGGTR